MLDVLVAVFVVVFVFAAVTVLFGVYVWHADPYQFATWRAALRRGRRPPGERPSPPS
ncbi:MAG TPA: hypothetical protein VFB42_02405 [Gaiellaceae bacterium]|nr:hypothetical protein [Gaiellaceae bacterium]